MSCPIQSTAQTIIASCRDQSSDETTFVSCRNQSSDETTVASCRDQSSDETTVASLRDQSGDESVDFSCHGDSQSIPIHNNNFHTYGDSQMSVEKQINKTQLKHESPADELNLSRRHFSSKHDLLKLCIGTPGLKHLIIRDIWISVKQQVRIPSAQPKISCSFVDTLAYTCPQLSFIDITGICGPTKRQLFGGNSFAKYQDRIKIYNFFDSNPLVKTLLTPSELQKEAVREKVMEIKGLVEKGMPADLSLNGWTLLHTACAVGDTKLARWLILKGGECTFEWKKSSLSIIRKTPESMEPFQVAMALHYDQMMDLFPGQCPNLQILVLNSTSKSKMDWYSTMHNTECRFTLLIQRLFEQYPYTKQQKQSFFQSMMFGCLQSLSLGKKPLTCYEDSGLSLTVQFLLKCGCSPNVQVCQFFKQTFNLKVGKLEPGHLKRS